MVVNILYPADLRAKDKKWSEPTKYCRDVFLGVRIDMQFIIAVSLLGCDCWYCPLPWQNAREA